MKDWTHHTHRTGFHFETLVQSFFVKYAEGLAFLAGLTAYPIGSAFFALMGWK
jgi:hypothetical protein